VARLTFPALSASASGQLGDTLTYRTFRGRTHTMRRVKPRQPGTYKQIVHRALILWLTRQWDRLTLAQKTSWQSAPLADATSPYHAYLSHNINRYHDTTTPVKRYDHAGTYDVGIATTLVATSLPRAVQIKWTSVGPLPSWSYALLRRTVVGETHIIHKQTIYIHHDPATNLNYIDSAVIVGTTYYYKLIGLTDDGHRGEPGFTAIGTPTA
jgi:hypothetical protein